jgi:uncharacterized protein
MNAAVVQSLNISEKARRRFLARDGRPLFLGNWERAMFIHYEADPDILQKQIPFELDLWRGMAVVSVVAFSMRRLRPAFGGRLTERLFLPIANHEFLNVRTYVRPGSQPGIYFMAEWVNNPLSLLLGPRVYGLPYRYGRIAYEHHHERGTLTGRVAGSFAYAGKLPPETKFNPCQPGSLDEFLVERYSAFTHWHGTSRMFNIWHEPWPQCRIELNVENGLLLRTGHWFNDARQIGANYSPGVENIWMGAPRLWAGR